MKDRIASSAPLRLLNGWLLACLVAAAATPAFAFNIGDVLAGVGAGQTKRFSPTGTLLQTLNSGSGSSETTGMCFDGLGNLFDTQFSTSTVAKFSPTGAVLTYPFGSGFLSAESCIVNAAGNIFFGQASGGIKQVSPAGASITTFAATTGPRGTDWIELSPDQCTMYYTSEGNLIRRYNVCTSTQLANFATLPVGSDCYANKLRPNGELMVACHSVVYRLSPAGAVLQTYVASLLTPAGSYLFALNLDPDNSTFWTADIFTGQIWRVNIGTGATVTSFNGGILGGSLAGLAVVGEITGTGPPPPPSGPIIVPTLQGWALVALSIVLAFFGLRARARSRH